MKRPTKIPTSVRACLWSSNLRQLDWAGQRGLVITQVLNRGTLEAVRWIIRLYGMRAIRNVVKNPRRGLWFPSTLQFWLTFFRMSIKPSLFEAALFSVVPSARKTRKEDPLFAVIGLGAGGPSDDSIHHDVYLSRIR